MRFQMCAAIQGHLDRVEKWTDRNLMEVNEGKYQVLPMGKSNPRYQYTLGTNCVEGNFAEKDLVVLADSKPNMSPQ